MCELVSPRNGHEWFKDCIDFLGCREVAKIWGKSEPQVYRWARDPTAHLRGIQNNATPNPILKLQTTLNELSAAGNENLALAVIEILKQSIPKAPIKIRFPRLLRF